MMTESQPITAPLNRTARAPSRTPRNALATQGLVLSVCMDFSTFYQAERVRVVGLAYVLSGNRFTAEDIAQDAFLAAYRNWDRVASLDNPAAWVNRVAANRSTSVFRKNLNEAKALLRLSHQHVDYPTLDDSDLAFWRAVRRLPKRQAQSIALFYVNDLSVADIAVVLGCSEGSVKTHLSRGRHSVAHELELQ